MLSEPKDIVHLGLGYENFSLELTINGVYCNCELLRHYIGHLSGGQAMSVEERMLILSVTKY